MAAFTNGLNEDQLRAFNDMVDFIDSDDAMYVLKGYAGTGKTFMIQRFIKYFLNRKYSQGIAITAPTNKAVKVIKAGAAYGKNSHRVDFMTIHALLELKEKITSTGQLTFVPETNKPLKVRGRKVKPRIENFKIVIVDETSMLSHSLFRSLLNYAYHESAGKRVKIIFLGDPAQIPPIGEKGSIPFLPSNDYKFRKGLLSEIMRQAEGNPIIQASFALRDNLEKSQPIPVLTTDTNDAGKGIIHLDASDQKKREYLRDFILPLLFEKEFVEDPDFAKVIAWRNKTVDLMNSLIRKPLFGWDIDDIVVGEKLIINKPIVDEKKRPIFQSSDEVEVVDAVVTTLDIHVKGVENDKQPKKDNDFMSNVFQDISKHTHNFKVYECRVKMSGGKTTSPLTLLHKDSKDHYNEILKKLKKHALKLRTSEAWVSYYTFMRQFADVSYNYAITAHKAQGSTYKNVVILEEDLDANANIIERNKIKYTAYSRAAETLYVLKFNKNG